MRLFVGTSGYSYPAWKGRFYPLKMPASGMLTFYAERFASVEINNTFYRLPQPGLLASWAEKVPAGFQFAVKSPQQITHQKRLRNSVEALEQLGKVVAELGRRTGPVLFQLPPNMKADVPRLDDFLGQVPRRLRVAFEFRHPTWFDDAVYSTLQKHAAAFCVAESDELECPRIATAGFGYLRLRKAKYTNARLANWCAFVRSQKWSATYVYFKHEDEAKGPVFASRFCRLWDGL